MKKQNKLIFGAFIAVIALTGLTLFFGCKKAATLSLGALPNIDFTATVGTDGYTVTIVNTSADPVIPYYTIPDLSLGTGDLNGDTVKVMPTFPGTYKIVMYAAGQGGIDSVTKSFTTTEPNPAGCDPTKPLGFIASCTQKTWKLNPAPGAMMVGQNPDDGGWWTSGAGEVTGPTSRPCMFNDEYTFTYDKAGDFVYNDNGDFYSDDASIMAVHGCYDDSNYAANQAAWGSGNFHYVVIPGGGIKGLGQLKVVGFGAHLVMQRPINGTDAFTYVTANSVTYDIWKMTLDSIDVDLNHYDFLTVTFHYGNWSPTDGWWTYTLRADHAK